MSDVIYSNEEDVEFIRRWRCRCGLVFGLVKAEHEGEAVYALSHELPVCEKFHNTDTEELLRERINEA